VSISKPTINEVDFCNQIVGEPNSLIGRNADLSHRPNSLFAADPVFGVHLKDHQFAGRVLGLPAASTAHGRLPAGDNLLAASAVDNYVR
jgi:hypothetical protein